jgi:CheY-like chemotaxis protein
MCISYRYWAALLCSFVMTVHIYAQSSDQSLEILRQQIEKEGDPAKRVEVTLMLAEKMLVGGQIADADHFAEQATNDAKKVRNTVAQANAMDVRGEVCRARFDYTNALVWYSDAQKIRQANNDQRGLAKSELLVGQVLFVQKEADSALPHLKRALELFVAESNVSGQAKTQKLLGEVYLQKQVFGSAQEHIKAAIDAYVELGDHQHAAALAGKLGRFAAEIGDHEGAMVYLRQSFNLHVGANDKAGMATDFVEMSKVLVATQQFGEAQSNLVSANLLYTEVNDTMGMCQALLALCGIPGEQKALHLKQVQMLLNQAAIKSETPQLLAQLATAWSGAGDQNAAFVALSMSNKLAAQLGATQKQKELVELDMRYQSEIAENTRRRTIERLEIEQSASGRVRWALIGLLALGAFALWSVWSNYRLKKVDNKLLHSKNNEIAQANGDLQNLNGRLDDINQRLVHEIAEREMLENNVFEKDKFLAIVSREMKQPLQQIIRATAQLNESGPRQLTAAEMNEMQFSANNLLVFINDMLDYNKIETGKLQLESHLFDPALIFNEIRERFASQLRDQGITFRMEYDSAIPTQLSGDPVRLNQVVSKILQYLPVASDAKSVTLSIMHGKRTPDQLYLDIQIIGLDPTDMQELNALHNSHNSVFRADEEDQRARTFSLAMVHRLIKMQEGECHAQVENQHLLITLPFSEQVPAAHREKLSKETIDSVITNKRILVVEDNKINQLVVSNLLKAHGAQIITADDGEEGLIQMQRYDIDLVLMDIQLPKLDGYRATAEIRKMPQPQKKNVSIIALTASAYLTDKDKAGLFQMNDHIGKPFSPEELLEKVVAVFQGEKSKA